MSVELLPAYDFQEEIGLLFSEYTDMLIANDSSFREYLKQQNYEEELKHLNLKYGMPDGRLYLACFEGKPAGCIGLRRMNSQDCEMKRLYVRPRFRGRGIGRVLVDRILKDGKAIGYQHMFLDTFPFLQSAINMYKQYGFYEIESYNNSPMDGLLYMRKDFG